MPIDAPNVGKHLSPRRVVGKSGYRIVDRPLPAGTRCSMCLDWKHRNPYDPVDVRVGQPDEATGFSFVGQTSVNSIDSFEADGSGALYG